MTKTGMGTAAIRDLQTLLDSGAIGGLSDGQLLERFLAARDGAAFEALARRHGPMVWGVCRRTLGDHHDAQDAFQATFLVLARRAASIAPREMVGPWLHGVACRTALKAKTTRARRRSKERTVAEMPEPDAMPRPPDDRLALLDQELARLPRKYRIPIVVCDLEGTTQEEAARRLGCPVGTLSGRLWRARAMLARRMTRRGLALSGGSLALLLAQEASAAGVPDALVARSAASAVGYVAGRAVAPTLVSTEVALLAEGVIKAMRFAHWKGATLILTTLGLFGSAMILMAGPPESGGQAGEEKKSAARAGSVPAARPPDRPEKAGPILRGRVVDQAGRPLAGVWVALYDGTATRMLGQDMLTGADGRYRFDPLKAGNPIRDEATGRPDLGVGLRLEHATHASEDGRSWWELRVPNVAGHEQVKDFTMVPGGTLEGRILDADTGKPIPGMDLMVLGPAGRGGKFGRHAMTAGDGRFVLSGFFPGEYAVRVDLTGLFPGEYADTPGPGQPTLGTVRIEAQRKTQADFPMKVSMEDWVARILDAHGGEPALNALTAFTETIRETPGGSKATTTKHFIQLPDKYRSETPYPGDEGTSVSILTPEGMQYWSKRPDGTALRVDRLTVVEPPYEYWLDMLRFFGPRTLLRLKDAGHSLTPLGESHLGGRPVVGIRVQKSDPKARADLRMIFDKETGRLLRVRDDPHATTTDFHDEQDFGKIPLARRSTIRRFSLPKETTEGEVVEIQAVDTFAPALFEEP